MEMELSNQEQKVVEELRKIPKRGECRLCLSFVNGKIVNIDLSAAPPEDSKNKNQKVNKPTNPGRKKNVN